MVQNGSRVCSSSIIMMVVNWVNCCHVTVAWPAIGQLMIMVRALIWSFLHVQLSIL